MLQPGPHDGGTVTFAADPGDHLADACDGYAGEQPGEQRPGHAAVDARVAERGDEVGPRRLGGVEGVGQRDLRHRVGDGLFDAVEGGFDAVEVQRLAHGAGGAVESVGNGLQRGGGVDALDRGDDVVERLVDGAQDVEQVDPVQRVAGRVEGVGDRGEDRRRVDGVEPRQQLGERLALQRLDVRVGVDGGDEVLHRLEAGGEGIEGAGVERGDHRRQLGVQLGACRFQVERLDRCARGLELVAQVVGQQRLRAPAPRASAAVLMIPVATSNTGCTGADAIAAVTESRTAWRSACSAARSRAAIVVCTLVNGAVSVPTVFGERACAPASTRRGRRRRRCRWRSGRRRWRRRARR